MACDFKSGDVVQPKSGGPRMTVIEIIGSDKVRTEWMDAKTRSRKEDVWACTSLVVPGDDFVYVG